MNDWIDVPYAVFINTFKKFQMKTRFIETDEKYVLRAWDEVFRITCDVFKTMPWEKNHFESHYQTNFNTVESNVSGAFTSTQTNAIIWNTTSGKRFVVRSMSINIRNATLAAQSMQIFDETNSGNNRILNISIAAGSEQNIQSQDAFVSSAVDNKLRITTSGSLTVNGRFKAYEVF